MSIFNKMLAKVGIGAAEIDTLLEQSSYVPGEEVRGLIKVRGGQVDQQIDRIYVHLQTRYIRELNERIVRENYTIAKFNVSGPILLASGEELEFPFAFALPLETPLTMYDQPVWLNTGLDIQVALDPCDQDSIEVRPHPYMQAIFEAAQSLGFRYRSSTCEYQPQYGRGVPFAQEFEFLPGPAFAHHMKELELIFYLRYDGLDLLIELDRKSRGLGGLFERVLDMDERHAILTFSAMDLEQRPAVVAQRIETFIQQHSI